ncbi:uncharacterized protein CC84DRAFT_961878 [Paraphaeosphaeria sporulosa]|uniref:Uncharacterized protein n=1 Tax=Paraphaeosphaeria sporulosa TaxID=1460663 RepID=A0A177C8S9_9PLEO|nr:uncharacterized protein CC84DRAFT_961878 [Paraphaeosphaeria sporulosa]OAG03178.1 hypothetical protein CC84DRAFT_961878 [Paraphaeosphaeria sporulosa]
MHQTRRGTLVSRSDRPGMEGRPGKPRVDGGRVRFAGIASAAVTPRQGAEGGVGSDGRACSPEPCWCSFGGLWACARCGGRSALLAREAVRSCCPISRRPAAPAAGCMRPPQPLGPLRRRTSVCICIPSNASQSPHLAHSVPRPRTNSASLQAAKHLLPLTASPASSPTNTSPPWCPGPSPSPPATSRTFSTADPQSHHPACLSAMWRFLAHARMPSLQRAPCWPTAL